MRSKIIVISIVTLLISRPTQVWSQQLNDKLGYIKKYYRSYNKPVNKSRAKYYVTNRNELIDAFKKIKSGECIYIADNASINVSGLKYLTLPPRTIIASGRNSTKPGGLLYSDSANTSPLLYINGDNVRITGLRIKGPDTAVNKLKMRALGAQGKYYSIPTSNAIVANNRNKLEIDNCELWGWTQAAIFLRNGARGNLIHHCYIHHNQRDGLGYGISLDSATAKIYNNVFEWNNHSVAATGKKGTSYEAFQNVILHSYPETHIFDMHGGKDRRDGTDIAGDSVFIHNNIIYSNSKLFAIRGKPIYKFKIYNNIFVNGTQNFRNLENLKQYKFMQINGNSIKYNELKK